MLGIYNENNFIEDQLSIAFDTSPSWINILSNGFGQVTAGESTTMNLNINSDNLENNLYQSYLHIDSNATINNSIIPITLSVTENGMLLGDINQDGIIDVLDVVAMVGFIIDATNVPDDQEACAADYNGDGGIDVLDVVAVVGVIIN